VNSSINGSQNPELDKELTKETRNYAFLGNLYLLLKDLLSTELIGQLLPAMLASHKLKRRRITVFLHNFILAVV
jgi:hypothetical protein